MKKTLLYSLLILMNCMQTKQATAQSYQNYHHAVHLAEVLIWQGDYSNALKEYKNAFQTVDYILNKELNNSLTCAAIVEDTSFLFTYLPIFMERGLILDRLEAHEPFKKWAGYPQWKKLETEMPYYKNVYFSSIDTAYLRVIDSLNSIDQNVRNRIHSSCFSPYTCKTKRVLRERLLVRQVDSSVQKCIWEYIQKWGYLDERISGGKYAQHSPVCYHHFTDSAFVAFQYEMVLQGRMSPEEYASKLLYMSSKDTLLNYWEANTLAKVKRVDARRNLIGLPSYSELRLFVRYMNSERKYPFIFYTTTTTIKKIKQKKMVLICSSVEDISTCYVMDWIEKFGHEVVRINEDCQIINITSSFYESENNFTFVLNDGRRISSQNVSSFWFRRGGLRFSQSHFPTMNQSIGINVTNHLKDEVKTLISYILFYLQNKTKIGDYSQRNANKLISLQIAQECGLRIPKTCISSQKTDLMDFSSECTSSITKSIQDILFFHVNDERFSTKTSKVTMADINTMDDFFFPSLLQEEIKKKYELRIFYLKGEFFPMAIFSQEDEQTKVDFRNYNKSKPNRCVPYKLPDYIMKKLDLFMQRMNLDTGSIDMIYTTNKEYVFLEVNPVGQYDMVSVPCNYNLHQKIAKYLCQ